MADKSQNPSQARSHNLVHSHIPDAGKPRVLVVSAQTKILESITGQDVAEDHLELASSGASAFTLLTNSAFQIVVLDGKLPDLNGNDLARMILVSFPDISVISHRSDNSAEFTSLRALHPIVQSMVRSLNGCSQRESTTDESKQTRFEFPKNQDIGIRTGMSFPEVLPKVVGDSGPMALVSRLIRLVAARNSTVLLTGETGTGKERLARAIHDLSPRHRQPFVVVNCGAIPESLFESELFGFERGAFTGAQQSRMGKIQAARGGTLFLDEVGELPMAAQAKLLRFLQEREIQRLGSNENTKVDVRVIAATNADLQCMVAAGTFRKDLFYRLNVFPIALPPLRLRREDIPILANHFLSNLCRESAQPIKHFSAQTIAEMTRYEWPGNVRELEYFVERAFIFAESSIEVECDIPASASNGFSEMNTSAARLAPSRLDHMVDDACEPSDRETTFPNCR